MSYLQTQINIYKYSDSIFKSLSILIEKNIFLLLNKKYNFVNFSILIETGV